jgi:hypothetical protein
MTEDDKPVSALPEKFEEFEQQFDGLTSAQMDRLPDAIKAANEATKPKRRRSTPAVKPKDMPEPEKPKRPTAADVPGVGGMRLTKWSGIPMWVCDKCHGTTFDEAESKVHQCKRMKYADEEGLE